jgi:hypothetical protein
VVFLSSCDCVRQGYSRTRDEGGHGARTGLILASGRHDIGGHIGVSLQL